MKFRLLLLFALLFSACTPEIPTTEPPADEIPTQTETPAPSGNEEPSEKPSEVQEPPAPGKDAGTPTETPTPTATPFVCAKLISPENGLELPAVGKVTFAWESIAGAVSYLLNFTLPTGDIVTFETDETNKDRYMEAFGMSGEFEWNVAALNVNKNEVCISETALFTKPAKTNNSNGGNGGSEGGCPPGSSPDGIGGCVVDGAH